MKHEIRFRAWHEEDKVMVYDLNTPRLFHGVLQPDDYKLMRCTGIKDKNGKYIYEGDILDEDGVISRVQYGEYDNGENYEDCCEGVGFYTTFSKNNNIYSFSTRYKYKIIGNIYETPELTEKK